MGLYFSPMRALDFVPLSLAALAVMTAGGFEWHTGPLTHTITNVRPTRFEAIEAVWK